MTIDFGSLHDAKERFKNDLRVRFEDPLKINVPEDRQRKDLGDIDVLAASIRHLGVLQPIIVRMENGEPWLVAGERRLRASIQAELSQIPVRDLAELSVDEVTEIELEENVQRKSLTWQEDVEAVVKFHNWMVEHHDGWTSAATAKRLRRMPEAIRRCIAVSEALAEGDSYVKGASSLAAAWNIVERRIGRKIDTELSKIDPAIFGTGNTPSSEDEPGEPLPSAALSGLLPIPAPPASAELYRPAERDLIHGDFFEFAQNYTGKKFNFGHFDFPYGINHDKSDQGGASQRYLYKDSPDLYWSLCACLAENLDKLFYGSCHIMFWFSMNYYSETIEFFQKNTDLTLVSRHPLYWHKTDNKGILPDPRRGPRQIVETALMFSRRDREVVKPVSNCHGGPTNKSEAFHSSEKPEPMLRHFFQMFVDENTEMLDPTCGSGSALRAAESLKAKRVFGLEANPEMVEHAQAELNKARRLRAIG